MNVYTKLYEEAELQARATKEDFKKLLYKKLGEERLVKNDNGLFISFEDVLNRKIAENRVFIKGKFKITPRNKKSTNFDLGKKTLEMFSKLLLLNAAYEKNQEDISNYGEKDICEILFKNKRINSFSNEEVKIRENEKIEFYILSAFEEMLSYSNGKIYVALIRDKYISLEYKDKKEIAEQNHMSVVNYENKIKQALSFFGDILANINYSK